MYKAIFKGLVMYEDSIVNWLPRIKAMSQTPQWVCKTACYLYLERKSKAKKARPSSLIPSKRHFIQHSNWPVALTLLKRCWAMDQKTDLRPGLQGYTNRTTTVYCPITHLWSCHIIQGCRYNAYLVAGLALQLSRSALLNLKKQWYKMESYHTRRSDKSLAKWSLDILTMVFKMFGDIGDSETTASGRSIREPSGV